MHCLAHGAPGAGYGQVFAGLEVSWAAAAHDDGAGCGFANGDFAAPFEGGDYFEADDKMLLEFLSAAVIGCCYPELQPLPSNGESCIVRVRVLVSYRV